MLGVSRSTKLGLSSALGIRLLRTTVLGFLISLIFLPGLGAQSRSISSTASGMALYINILEGENALNNIRDRTAREPIVQVVDENHKPVRGAAVTFTTVAGATGAGAAFGGLLTYTTVTDDEGKAVGRGLTPNSTVGDFRIDVSAAVGMLIAAIVIHQRNISKEPVGKGLERGGGVHGSGFDATSKWFIAEFAAAATGVGIYLGVHPEGSSGLTANSATPTTPVAPTTPVSVPEIDLSMAFGGLVLLAGSVAVLRGR